MKNSLLVKYIFPFVMWFGLMLFITLMIDLFLHRMNLIWVGRYLGAIGTSLLLLSFLYSLRKRKKITSGSPKKYLLFHEYMAWFASILLLVHSGIHFNALLPWLATSMLLLVVAFGLVGKFILHKATEALNVNRQNLLATGLTVEESEQKLFFDSITLSAMKQWRAIHLPLSLLLALLALTHIATILIFRA